MSYKACFQCELLFEVDESSPIDMVCPQCGAGLEDYEPDADELDPEDFDYQEKTVAIMGDVADSPILASLAFDGLAGAVRNKLAARKTGAPPSAEDESTRMLDAVSDAVLADPPLARTQAIDLSAGAGALPVPRPAPVPVPRPKPKYGTIGSKDSAQQEAGRHTRMDAIGDIGDLAAPAPATPAPAPRADPAPARPAPIPHPSGPTPAAAPPRRVTPRSAPTAVPRAPTPGPSSARRPAAAKKKSKAPIIVALVVLLGGGGFAGWYFGLRDSKPKPGPTEQPQVTQTFGERVSAELEAGQALLPVVAGAQTMDETAYLVGGPEGLRSSSGLVPGLPSTQISEALIDSDADGEWVKPLRTHIDRNKVDASTQFALGLDGTLKTQMLVRLANAGRMAGVKKFGLMVGREEQAGDLGTFAFDLATSAPKLPDSGALVVRVGRLGFHVTAKNAEDAEISTGDPMVARQDNGKLDMRAFDERIAALLKEHAQLKTAVVHPNPDMTVNELASVFSRLSTSPDGPRFGMLVLTIR